MNMWNIGILLFILSAFMFGVGLQEQDRILIDNTLNNVSNTINNVDLNNGSAFNELKNSSIPNAKGLVEIIEQGMKFMGVVGVELFRGGAYFGYENPEYFSPVFIIKILKLIIILVIISLLIKPLFYVGILLIMGFIWLKDKRKNKNENKKETKS